MSPPERSSPQRRLRDAIEPFHGHCYYVEELHTPYVDVHGLHPWAAYFGQRAAPMGAVTAEVVTAVFYGFSPRLVSRSIPSVWRFVPPEAAWQARTDAVTRALRRLLPDVDGDSVDELNELADRTVHDIGAAGRPLGASTAAMPGPTDPLAALWHRASVLREFRGDAHVAALSSHGVGPLESILTSHGYSNLSMGFHRKARGWSDDQWAAGVERAVAAGWIDGAGALTDAGRAIRAEIEADTDRGMLVHTSRLNADELDRLTEGLWQLSRAVQAAGGFPG